MARAAAKSRVESLPSPESTEIGCYWADDCILVAFEPCCVEIVSPDLLSFLPWALYVIMHNFRT